MLSGPAQADVRFATAMGVSRSLDFGATWEDASAGLPEGRVYAVASDAAHATLYAGLQDGALYVAHLADVAPDPRPSAWGPRVAFGGHHGAPPEGRDDDERRDGFGSRDGPASTPGASLAMLIGAVGVAAWRVGRRGG
jgi:hypothetical protein